MKKATLSELSVILGRSENRADRRKEARDRLRRLKIASKNDKSRYMAAVRKVFVSGVTVVEEIMDSLEKAMDLMDSVDKSHFREQILAIKSSWQHYKDSLVSVAIPIPEGLNFKEEIPEAAKYEELCKAVDELIDMMVSGSAPAVYKTKDRVERILVELRNRVKQ